jgi:UDP-N-acetylmuramoyl-tripeptide--D-alanyl-D-alanine ligase
MHYAILSFLNLKETDKIFLLGDMLELGEESITEHQEIVNLLVDKNQKNVILIGPEFLKTKPIDTYLYFTNTSEAANFLKDNSIVDKFILIKGSRGIGLETLLTYL